MTSLRRRSLTATSGFVGSGIDYPWSYIAGDHRLIEGVSQDRRIEAVVVDSGDAW
jgi:hypothetical protein